MFVEKKLMPAKKLIPRMKPQDTRGNSMYTKDDVGFLVVNFCRKLPCTVKPFIFLSQATKVYFSNVVPTNVKKVVLYKEAKAKWKVLDCMNAFITTTSWRL